MNEAAARQALADATIMLRGNPCVWGGEDDESDCSGVVRTIRRVVGFEGRSDPDYRSADIWTSWPEIAPEDVKPGSLALYGWPLINHVMVVTGPWYWRPIGNGVSEWVVPVCGASGALPWIRTVAQARKAGAQVRDFASHLYRNNGKLGRLAGFRGFRDMPEFQRKPLRLEEALA